MRFYGTTDKSESEDVYFGNLSKFDAAADMVISLYSRWVDGDSNTAAVGIGVFDGAEGGNGGLLL